MTRLEDPETIEETVGATRHPILHIGRAVSAEERVYILHSRECIDAGIDLRDCRFSIAADEGIDLDVWEQWQDSPMVLAVNLEGDLIPTTVAG